MSTLITDALKARSTNGNLTISGNGTGNVIMKNLATSDDTPMVLTLQTGEVDMAADDVIGTVNFQAPDEGTGTDAILVAAGIEAVSEGDFSSSSNATKLSFKTASSAAAAETMSLSSGGNLDVTGTIQGTTITAETAFVPDASDGAALGTTALEFSDLFLADGAVVNFGDDQDVTLTHVADAGLLLNTTMYLTFRDSALKIYSSADGQLDIDADTEVEITATTIDVNGTTNFSGAITPAASDGAALGTTSLEWSDLYLADGAVLGFGDDQDVTLTHVADTGLILKNAHTSGNSGIGAVLTLQTGDTDMADGNVMGHIKFQAPNEGAGTDAILVAAGILAEAEGDFSSSSNATALVFQTASTDTAAEQMRLDSNGDLGIGVANPTRQLHIAKSAAADITALSDGSTITPDFAAAQNFSVTLAGNRTLANPSNIVAGQTGSIVITQDGTGSRTLAYGGYWDFAAGEAPTLTTTAAGIDRIDYYVATATDIHAVATLAMS